MDRSATIRCIGSLLGSIVGWIASGIVALAPALAEPPGERPPFEFCDQDPHGELCASLPNDNVDFDASFVYLHLTRAAQRPFDRFSWQSFVALNWPTAGDGALLEGPIGSAPEAPRRWQRFERGKSLNGTSGVNGSCGAQLHALRSRDASGAPIVLESYLQASGQPLIDRNLNFVLFDTRLNDTAAAYVRGATLATAAGQRAHAGRGDAVEFPVGHYARTVPREGGKAGSVLLKFAWRILDAERGDDPARFLVRDALIALDAAATTSGEPLCIERKVGLVAMHIVRRTRSGNGGEWIWTTFEHVDNAPPAVNNRGPTSIFTDVLFANDQCVGPPAGETRYSFYDAACTGCASNRIEPAAWRWSRSEPFASAYAISSGDGDRRFGTQAVRCWRIFEDTRLVNAAWRQALSGTPFEHYMLVTTQWRGGPKNPLFPAGEVPRYAVNTALETYVQTAPTGSCMACHADARTGAGQPANFTFVLSRTGD